MACVNSRDLETDSVGEVYSIGQGYKTSFKSTDVQDGHEGTIYEGTRRAQKIYEGTRRAQKIYEGTRRAQKI